MYPYLFKKLSKFGSDIQIQIKLVAQLTFLYPELLFLVFARKPEYQACKIIFLDYYIRPNLS